MHIGRREVGHQREPYRADSEDYMQLLAIDPLMPVRFAPVGLRINRRMRHDPLWRDPS